METRRKWRRENEEMREDVKEENGKNVRTKGGKERRIG
jgi:hypothetical protein